MSVYKQPLSENQQGIWHLQAIHPALHAYNTSSVFWVRSPLNVPRLRQALSQLAARLPLLRMTFPLQADHPQRVVHDVLEPLFAQVMISTATEADLQRTVQAAHAQPFDLTTGPLVRLTLFTRAADEHVLLLTFHHILLDFGSQTKVTQLLFDLYVAAVSEALSLTDALEVSSSYDDFVTWQQAQLASPAATKARDYWLQQLQAPLPILNLPTDRPLPRQQTFNGNMVRFALPATLSQDLMDLARQQQITPFTLFLTAFAVLMARYSNQDDLIVGIPTDERLRAPRRFQQTLGHMVNLLPMRVDFSAQPTFLELAKAMQRTVMGGLLHQQYPFTRMIQDAQRPHNPSRPPLFDVVFNMPVLNKAEPFVILMEGTPIAPVNYRGLQLESFDLCQQAAQTFLNLDLWTTDNGFVGFLKYNSDLFDEATITRMAGHFAVLLESIAQDIDQPVLRLPLLTTRESHQLNHAWNKTAVDFGEPQTIHALFEQQVKHTPDAVAVVMAEDQWQESEAQSASQRSAQDQSQISNLKSLTYAELNARANQLAHALIEMGIGPDVPVGICLERSPTMVVGLLGILKAGGAYVPLDPSYPAERLAYMIDDAQIKVLLTQHPLTARLPLAGANPPQEHENQPRVIDLDQDNFSTFPITDPAVGVTLEQLIYVIYTSGSTGRPKGVEALHRNTFYRLHWMWATLPFAEGEILCQKTALSFVDSVWEIFGPLLRGIPIVIIPDDVVKDPARFVTTLAREGITRLVLVPSLLQSLLDAYPDLAQHLPRLAYWTCSGEALSTALAQRFYRAMPAGTLLNLYGSSEVAGDATWHKVDPTLLDRTPRGGVPIGRPLANTQVRIVDPLMQPVPIGVPGELYIGGKQLARGYRHRPDLSNERFIEHPQFGRLYKTGDRCRWLPDGAIEFLGRTDFQVKIRGFRIELGEIEQMLLAHVKVREAVATVQEDKLGQRLVAYFVGDVEPETLRRRLAQQLPAYMIPAVFVRLNALPLTPNGKLDRQSLPAVTAQQQTTTMYIAPRSRLERQIAAIWQELLGLAQVGLHDNFFELGGHSLLIVQMHSRLQKLVTQRLAVTDCFQYPTVAALAAYLGRASETKTENQPQSTAQRAAQSANDATVEIAIIGMACRLPGANAVDEFWENLRQGKESIALFSDEELLAAGVDPVTLNAANYVKAGTVLADITSFDAAFFNFTPREAELLDPQQRLLLECASEVIEGAGYDVMRYPGAIGLYAGVGMNTYLFNHLGPRNISFGSTNHFQTMLANDKDFLATRVAYKLNLTGPSVNVQTACSTALVAVHLACQSLRAGECDMALAGGASIQVPQKQGYLYQAGMITSPDGHCRAFSDAAQGTVGGNGAGIVLLKRLADALADGDTIHAVIKGSAMNNDGADKVSYTAPSVSGQTKVIRQAQAAAGCPPETISYVEAHGTGTALGDPIEIAALTAAFQTPLGRGCDENRTLPLESTQATDADFHTEQSINGYCAIGSVKTNIGHADVAAGVAGLIKTVLALQHRQLPPSLHFERPNPAIDFANSPFYVNSQLTAWASDGKPRRAGVSSFGIGGTNAHVVLEEAPQREPSAPAKPWQLLLLSAKSPAALAKAAENLAAHLQCHPELNLADVAYTLAVGRQRHPYRQMVLAPPDVDAAEVLVAHERAGNKDRGALHYAEAQTRPVAFLFPGQGAQYVNMGHGLYEREPIFRATVDHCADYLHPRLGLDLRTLLYPQPEAVETSSQQLEQTAITQPALFVVSYALAQLWRSWGVTPQALLGHSIGEYVAATLAGVFALEDALDLVVARGRLMQQQAPGAMLAISLAKEALALGPELSLAAVNSPTRCVVSGPIAAIEGYQQQLTADGVSCRRLHTSHAFHSAMMDSLLDDFVRHVKAANPQPPQIPIVSNLTGTWLTAEEATDPRYWASHLRQTVHFAAGVACLAAEPDLIMLEVGPGQTLSTFVRQCNSDQRVLRSLPDHQERQADYESLLTNLGQLWLLGGAIDWGGVYAHEARRRITLPTYPFERQRYWIEPAKEGAGQPDRTERPTTHHAQKLPFDQWFYLPGWQRSYLPAAQSTTLAAPSAVETESKNTWLLFVDNVGLGAQLAKQLRDRAHDVITVQSGAEFRRVNAQSYALAPGDQQGYEQLIHDVIGQGKHPQQIVHLWSLNAQPLRGAVGLATGLAMNLTLTFDSLIFLAQALGSLTATLQLTVITNNLQEVTGEEPLTPEQSTVLGPVKVIPQEFPHVHCCNIDVSVALGVDEQRTISALLIDQLAAEIEHGANQLPATANAPQPAQMIALRGKHRWQQTMQPVQLAPHDVALANPPINPPVPIRENGVYLITGGLGGIGLTLAEYLASFSSRLILVARTPLPARPAWTGWLADHEEADPISAKIRKILALEAAGAQVLPLCADVCDVDEMQQVVATGLAHFGQLNGVIHAAGVPGGGMILRKQQAATRAVLAPKVQGALVLDALLKTMALDFVLFCSSLAAVVGELGQVDYTAANAFLDAFAQATNGQTRVASINWDTWQTVGMAVATTVPQELAARRQQRLDLGIAPEEGKQVFSSVLQSHFPQVIVSTVDLPTRASQSSEAITPVARAAQRHTHNLYERPNLGNHYVAPGNATEQEVAEIWCELLGVAAVGVEDDFFALGGDSLLATQLMARLRERTQVTLPLRTFFECRTIGHLADKLDRYRMIYAMQAGTPAKDNPLRDDHALALANESVAANHKEAHHEQEEREQEIW